MSEQVSSLQKLINTVIEFMVQYSFQVIGAVIVLVIGFVIANAASNATFKMLQKKNFDITLSKFLAAIVRIVIIGFAVLISLGKFGITITPFVAALGALTFGASFAVQGPLSNYGAGLSIILSRPFVVGDTITVSEVSGVVKEVKLACTILNDEDGVKITIPNKDVVGKIIFNSSKSKMAQNVIGIAYADSPERVIELVLKALASIEMVRKEPRPQVGIKEFGDSSINIEYRFWVPTEKYFQTVHAANLEVFKTVTGAGFSIPFPQREVKIISGSTVS